MRLTLLYGGLFLLSGAALMAIAYALLVNAGFVFTLQNGTSAQPPTDARHFGPPRGCRRGFPGPGSTTHPSAQTMAHWRAVAQCMRQHGVSGLSRPTTSVPSNAAGKYGDDRRSRRSDPRDPGHDQHGVAGVHAGGDHVRVHGRLAPS